MMSRLSSVLAVGTILTLSSLLSLLRVSSAAPSFMVSNNQFLLNGEPFTIRSGSFHYHRCIPDLWEDRMRRLAAMGLNTIQTYVPWNWHEFPEEHYDFASYGRNITQFIVTAQKVGLLVLVRAGPYICGEHDFGGIPASALTVPGIELRTNNSQYLTLVDNWWNAFLPVIAPLTVANGGPIAMVQIENEYGSYGNTGKNPADKAYMEHLKDLVYSHLGGPSQIQLYTTDGGDVGYMTGGTLPGEVFATGDWGPDTNIPPYWQAEDTFNPPGMQAHTDSEYYTGWLTHWTEGMANTSTIGTVGGVAAILAYNGSFNLYMGYGGTNWGFWNGANGGGSSFQPVITSYDYDSPVSEGGIHGYGPDGDKYAALQQLLTYWADGQVPSEPPAPAVNAYGTVGMNNYADLWSNVNSLTVNPSLNQPNVNIMESYGQRQGYIIYRTVVPSGYNGNKNAAFNINGLADRGEVFLNGASVGVTYRPDSGAGQYTLPNPVTGQIIDIFIENMGHINYGHGFFDPKGITGGVTIDGTSLTGNWSAYPLPFDYNNSIGSLPYVSRGNTVTGPGFFQGTLTVTGTPVDTYITLCGWQKGQIYINDFHLGRYWETAGPQHSFYVPAPLLVTGSNTITVFEQHGTNADATVNFVDVPDFTGAVCKATSLTPTVDVDTRRSVRGETRNPKEQVPVSPVSVGWTGKACQTPTVGMNITAQDCSVGASNTEWVWNSIGGNKANAGYLSLNSNSNLCVGVMGTNPTSNTPNVALVTCNVYDRSQHFMSFQSTLSSSPLMSLGAIPGAGSCVDICGGVNAPVGASIDLYSCSGNNNQAWLWNNGVDSKQLISKQNNWCLAAC